MILVDRENELAKLRWLLDGCVAGRGSVALISGGVGCGKTELLHAFAGCVAGAGARLLTATASRAEQGLRLGVLGQLLADVAPMRPAGPDTVLDEQAAIAPAEAEPVHQACTALLDVARQQPVVVHIDDIHFADRSSLQALLYLQRRLATAKVLLVLTEWNQPQQPVFHAELTRRSNVHKIRLEPLSQKGIAELAGDKAAAVHQISGGNPLLVRALLEDEGEPGNAFGQAVLACLHRWESRLLRVGRSVAILGDASTRANVGQLAGLDAGDAAQVMDLLTAAGLLNDNRFRHPTADSAVLDGMSPEDRARMHLRAAELLHQHGASAVDLARHFVAADRVVGRWAVSTLRDAAEQALAEGHVVHATRCLSLALRSCVDQREQNRIVVALARAEWRVNPAAAAARLAPLYADLPTRDPDDRDVVLMFRSLLWQGRVAKAEQMLTALRGRTALANGRTVDELRVLHHLLIGRPLGVHLPKPDIDAAQENPWERATPMLDALAQEPDHETAAGAEQLLQDCRLDDATAELLMSALLVLLHADQPAIAATWCDALLAEAEARRANTWRAMFGSIRAEIALRQGELPTAVHHAETALSLLPTDSWGVLIGAPLSTLISVTTATGAHEDTTRLLDRPVPEAMFDTVFGLRYLHARGHHHLAADRVAAALRDFTACARLARAGNLDLPALVPWRTDIAQVHLRLNRRGRARELAANQLDSFALNARTRGITLRVLAATSPADQRRPLLSKATTILQRCGDRLELALALADLSQAHHELGERGQARMAGHRAIQEAEACHAEALRRRLSPDDIGIRGRSAGTGRETLSNAERRVAKLAALGLTNNDIAGKLLITVSTVEQHLTRVYRKLDVRREQLATALSAMPA